MKIDQEKTKKNKLENGKKRNYIKPKIQSEKLNSYGALCNGTTTGGRKSTVTGPSFCNAGRLNS
jgi:hypothetical protein